MHDYNDGYRNSQPINDLAVILAKGVLRYIRLSQSATITASNQASKNDLLFFSGHGSLSRELTDKELKEEKLCQ